MREHIDEFEEQILPGIQIKGLHGLQHPEAAGRVVIPGESDQDLQSLLAEKIQLAILRMSNS